MSMPISPLIWVLLGSRPGDNAQVLHLAQALGLPFETRSIAVKAKFELAKPRVFASLHHIDLAASHALAPPWPDLVLTIGRHMSMVGLWIKSQSPSTRLALIGPPKGEADKFDLIVVPMHYRVPDAPNVCRIGLPLLSADPVRLKTDGERLTGSLANLPKPLTVLLLGGSTGNRSIDPATALDLMKNAFDLRQRDGGSVFIATSKRTPADSSKAIERALPSSGKLYRWKANDPENPYFGLLAHGDRFVITGDSISMLVEVARLGKPLAIAQPRAVNRWLAAHLDRRHLPEGLVWQAARVAGKVIEWSKLGRTPGMRDFVLFHEFMYKHGWAVPLGKPFVKPPALPPDDTHIAVTRLRALLA